MSRPLPTLVLVGRPNVGKSTLFNRLCETRRALMSDVPGTTRDWQEGSAHWNGRAYRVIDTGGYAPGGEVILSAVRAQVERWVKEADVTLWVVDGAEGLSPADRALGGWMRSRARNVVVVVNKIDDANRDVNAAEFHALGYRDLAAVSAAHGRAVNKLLDLVESKVPGAPADDAPDGVPRVALLGRPNVGKSSMLNALTGEERMIVSDIPGTTRDAVDTLVERDGRRFLFIDTAGLRAKKSIGAQGLEGLTRIMSEKALDRAEVAVLLVDAREGITEGDTAVGRLIHASGRACVLGVNKWDLVTDHVRTAQSYRERHADDLPFLTHAPIVFVSAKTGQRVPELLAAVGRAHEAFHKRFDDEDISAFLWRQVQERPYSHHGRKLVFHGASQTGTAPAVVTIRCNLTEPEVHFTYVRHLENVFRKKYAVEGAPLVFRFKRGKR